MCLILTFETTHPYSSILAQPVPLLGPFPSPSVFCVCTENIGVLQLPRPLRSLSVEETALFWNGSDILAETLIFNFIFENSSGSRLQAGNLEPELLQLFIILSKWKQGFSWEAANGLGSGSCSRARVWILLLSVALEVLLLLSGVSAALTAPDGARGRTWRGMKAPLLPRAARTHNEPGWPLGTGSLFP